MAIIKISLKEERQAFDTHYNYSNCLGRLIKGVSLSYLRKLNKIPLKHLKQKENLIDLTYKSLQDEFNIVQQDCEYSYASTSWLPVKTYYLIYNQMLTIEYIIQVKKTTYNFSHKKCIEEFTRKLKSNELSFDNPLLNEVFDKNILKHKETSGANLSWRIGLERMFKLAMKKVANYKLDEWKRKNKVNLRTKTGRTKKQKYLDGFNISIFEFHYYMRIRSNYRDFAFIEGVSEQDTARYFNSYYNFSMNIFNALKKLKEEMVAVRG